MSDPANGFLRRLWPWGRRRIATALRERELELARANLMLRLVLDTIPVRVFWKDRTSRYLGCNRLFARDAGRREPEELIGEDDFAMGWSNEAELYRADDREVMESGTGRINYEEPQTTPEGRRIWLRTSKLPLRDAGGEVIGVLGTYEDITVEKESEEQRRQLEAQVQHVQKLESLGVLAGGIAHDFNNLLTGMLGNADLALSELSPGSPAGASVESIRTAAQRAAELCRQMLAYSGKGRFVIAPLDLSELVREMGRILEFAVQKKATLEYQLAEGLPAVEADATQLRQVVMNLITNASEALGNSGGRIAIATGTHECDGEYLRSCRPDEPLEGGTYVFLEVSDTGCGMDEETRTRLFEPFFTTKFTGRGLGLAAVLGIVHGHAGALRVYSEPGEGSTFKVLLPASAKPAERPAEAVPDDAWSGAGTVLLADDEEIVRNVGKRMLEHLGFEVVLAADGCEAVHLFGERSEQFACVILDLTMPRMDGEEAYRELHRLHPDVPILLASGFNEQEVTQRFVGAGLAGFLQKPFLLENLRQTMRRALAK